MAQSTTEAVLVFDDRHPAVTYSGAWVQGGSSGREYLNTTTWTTVPGASAAIDFYGNSITVIGTLSRFTATATLDISFLVDNSSSPFIVHLPQTIPPTYGVPLWSSPILGSTPSKHHLVITHATTQGSGSLLVLDAFAVGGYNVSGLDSVNPGPGSNSGDESATTTTKVLSIVFGVVLCLSLALCVFLFLRMRRYRQRWRQAEPHSATMASTMGSLTKGKESFGFGRNPHQDGEEFVDRLGPDDTHTPRALEPKPPNELNLGRQTAGQGTRVPYLNAGSGGLPGVGVHPPV